MPLLISKMAADAALTIGDPGMTRVRSDEWLLIYNQSIRELCERCDIMQYRATFDLSTEELYPYPDDLVQLTKVEVNQTPAADPHGWQEVKEMFEDEFREETNTRFPSASLPLRYFAETGWFWLVPRAEVAIVGAGRITYYGLPDEATDFTAGTFQLPHVARDYVTHRMVIGGMMARNRIVEAQAEHARWVQQLEGFEDRMGDRSKDRRSSIAPRKNRFAGMR